MSSALVKIHNNSYTVLPDEFVSITHPFIDPLTLHTEVAFFDREIAFINKLVSTLGIREMIDCGTTHGGYIGLNCNKVKNIYFLPNNDDHRKNISKNLLENKSETNFSLISDVQETYKHIREPNDVLIRIDFLTNFNRLEHEYGVIISNSEIPHLQYTSLKFGNRFINIKTNHWKAFKTTFKNYIKIENDCYVLTFDNLVNILIMVKNAGDTFNQVLRDNIPSADKFTILDTGSTDNTIQIIKEELKNVEYNLYQEPFINFRDSRNRLFELAGHDCVYNIVLDDTYVINGNIKQFLTVTRGCDQGKAFNLTVKGTDVYYGSCRITKSQENFRYKYLVHEIVDTRGDPNFKVHESICYINDTQTSYMAERTNTRKQKDLEWLFEDMKNNPTDARIPYYIAETYMCIKEWAKAYEYYRQRTLFDTGYYEEKQDSLYKMAVIADEFLHEPWEKCQQLYLDCFNFDPKRCESLFMIGSHYVNTSNKYLAYYFLKEAYKIGAPGPEYGMNLKVDIYNFYLPDRLINLAYLFKDYTTAISCCQHILRHESAFVLKNDNLYRNWLSILNTLEQNKQYINLPKKNNPYNENSKLLCFITDGGWKKWDGEVFETEGLGGSETSMIKYAEYIAEHYSNKYTPIIFCNCDKVKVYKKVIYSPVSDYIRFVSEYNHIALVNRYTEYAPMCLANNVPTFIVLHDLTRDCEIIIDSPYLLGILTLSEWHAETFKETYKSLAYKVGQFDYGINIEEFPNNSKIPRTLMYSSFPNRGLLELLKVFPKIIERYPDVKLNIFCDMDNEWANRVSEQEMKEIKRLLTTFSSKNLVNHGWVNGKTLKKFWSETDVWFYTCTFSETYCLTALEAQASKTLCLTNNRAALQNSVGDRGAIVQGDPSSDLMWMDNALSVLYDYFDNNKDFAKEKDKAFEYAQSRSYNKIVPKFISMLDDCMKLF